MKTERGITLIALVVTIIVLIILAGVSINLVLGDNGIITKAKQGKAEYSQAQAREKLELVLAELQTDKLTDIKYDKQETVNERLKENHMEIVGNVVIVNGWEFEIDRSVPKIASGIKEDILSNWLECANLNINDYEGETLQSIVNNEEVMKSLMQSENAVNYMIKNTSELVKMITNSENAMKALGESIYAGKKVIQSNDWYHEILNSPYIEQFDEGSITPPVMTSNSQDGYVAYSPSENNYAGGQLAYNAFDRRNTSASNSSPAGQYMCSNATKILPMYVQLTLPEEITFYKVKLYFYIDDGVKTNAESKGFIEIGEERINFETTDRQQEIEIPLPKPITSNLIRINLQEYNWTTFEQVTVSECIYYAR